MAENVLEYGNSTTPTARPIQKTTTKHPHHKNSNQSSTMVLISTYYDVLDRLVQTRSAAPEGNVIASTAYTYL